ncbi:MAG TPA: hypothetical protein VFP93_03880 [Gammaproteobacteria bacterium]|nr:hypothetical protein [Gammaproteobacteria bacterium]
MTNIQKTTQQGRISNKTANKKKNTLKGSLKAKGRTTKQGDKRAVVKKVKSIRTQEGKNFEGKIGDVRKRTNTKRDASKELSANEEKKSRKGKGPSSELQRERAAKKKKAQSPAQHFKEGKNRVKTKIPKTSRPNTSVHKKPSKRSSSSSKH